MKKLLLLAAAALAILMAGCGATGTSTTPTRGEGNPAVYDRMDSEACDELQAEFNQAMDNYDTMRNKESLDYGNYADDLMQQNGCYDS